MQMRHRSPLLLSGVRMGLSIVDGDDIQLLLLASAVDAVCTADSVCIVLALTLFGARQSSLTSLPPPLFAGGIPLPAGEELRDLESRLPSGLSLAMPPGPTPPQTDVTPMQALPAVPHVSAAAAVAAVGVAVHLQQLHAVTPPSAVTPMTPLSASPQAAFGMPARTSPVVLSPLGLVPGMAGLRWRGRVQVFGIRECAALRESGGATMFASRVMWEAFALARAQAAARGANAIIHFAINELRVVDSPQRNTVRAAVMVGFCGGGADERDRRTCCLRHPATQCLRPLAQWTTIRTREREQNYTTVFLCANFTCQIA
jgi:hypothetical protein